ncbi:sensor histidine kinase [Sphingomonas radiodurans]|uniref:sensor histidine kinase n=1 Tax=Sphingomonas radiodurans TaxID=2890321 RepID=UPI001E33D8B8|nr:sensor histidine kinase [Sphingomonas radiodurans]WBH16318.1 sensor histidine kinase [Sphingomonas radiodurans]
MTDPAQDAEHDQLLRDMNDALLASSVRQQELAEKAQLAEAKMEVMVAELQHRTRNLIAVVSAIANRTMARTGPTEEFRTQFNARLAALARVQGLLSRTDIEPITIGALVRMELDALGADASDSRVTLDGPDVVLRDTIVQTMALAIHELATNARKHGALAADDRTLTVTWSVQQENDAAPHLILEWVEAGVGRAPGGEEDARKGYGRELIERALPYALNAKTSFDLNDDGVRCTIDLPLVDRNRKRDLG